MRLIGYACRHPEPPVRQAFVPLGELTVLVGPNDSGKSTLLRAIVRDLAGGHFGEDSERDALVGGVFYLETSEEELDAVIHEAGSSRRRSGYGEVQSAPRPPWNEGLWSVKAGEDAERATLLELLGQSESHDTAVRDRIVARLGTSRILGLECAGRNQAGLRVWNAYWCVPKLDELGPEDVAAVKASDLQPFKRRREKAEGIKGSFSFGFYRAFHGVPSHLYADGAPVAVASLGALSTIGMPSGLVAPADFAELREAVSTSATALINMMARGMQDAPREEEFDSREQAERTAPRAWLTENDGWVGLSEEAMAAATFISTSATRLLPSFLTDRYRLDVTIVDVDEWFASDPLRVMMRPPSIEGENEDFPIEDVADGYRLWVQLALLNALEDAGRATSLLARLASDAYDEYMAGSEAYQQGHEEDREAEDEAARDAERRFKGVCAELEALEADGRGDWVSGDLERALQDTPGDNWMKRANRDRRLLVVDEPERHLHPRLQREAAKWLGELAVRRHAPLLVATHSPAFLSLPRESATYVSVHRTAEVLRISAFDPAALGALDELASEMGFDRGELVGLIDVWMVVEGETDQAALETLYANELSSAGIEIVPLHGSSKWHALLEADALWRFTTAPVAVMFDGVGPDQVAALTVASEDDLKDIARDGQQDGSARDMARLVATIRRLGKEIHPVPNDGADILDLLDEESVRAVFPDYPGHSEAEAAWQKHHKGTRDKFLKDRYGVEKAAEKFREIAQHMVNNEKKSTQLEAIVSFCQRLGE
jgi:hypothetical protein